MLSWDREGGREREGGSIISPYTHYICIDSDATISPILSHMICLFLTNYGHVIFHD